MVTIAPIRAFSDNYIWLLHDGRTAWVVDPGDAAPVESALQEQGLELRGILVTHHHADHVGGVDALLRGRNLPVYGPAESPAGCISERVREGDTVGVLGLELSVIETPGHTLDHIAYYTADRGDGKPLLLCGDTLFAGGCGRVFEGTPEMLYHSLQKLMALPAATEVYCAHEYTIANLTFATAVEPENRALQQRLEQAGELRRTDRPTVPSTLADEIRTNPFVRCSEGTVRTAAEQKTGLALGDPVNVFAAVREWKNRF